MTNTSRERELAWRPRTEGPRGGVWWARPRAGRPGRECPSGSGAGTGGPQPGAGPPAGALPAPNSCPTETSDRRSFRTNSAWIRRELSARGQCIQPQAVCLHPGPHRPELTQGDRRTLEFTGSARGQFTREPGGPAARLSFRQHRGAPGTQFPEGRLHTEPPARGTDVMLPAAALTASGAEGRSLVPCGRFLKGAFGGQVCPQTRFFFCYTW